MTERVPPALCKRQLRASLRPGGRELPAGPPGGRGAGSLRQYEKQSRYVYDNTGARLEKHEFLRVCRGRNPVSPPWYLKKPAQKRNNIATPEQGHLLIEYKRTAPRKQNQCEARPKLFSGERKLLGCRVAALSARAGGTFSLPLAWLRKLGQTVWLFFPGFPEAEGRRTGSADLGI